MGAELKILIKNGRVIDPKRGIDDLLDIYIESGLVSDIGVGLDYEGPTVAVLDAKGLIVAPGFVDMHCHLREPGGEKSETIETGTRAAAMGGFTSVACMPNTSPVIDSAFVVKYINNSPNKLVNVYPIGAITKGQEGKELAAIGEMRFEGIVAISEDGKSVADANLMRRALQYAKMFDITVISHCEDSAAANGGVMHEGYYSTIMGLRGITPAAEEIMTSRDIILAEHTGAAIHIAHVSTRGSVEMIRRAKQRGVRVTCEVCPHHFTLTHSAVDGFNTNAKMSPPLREQADIDAICEGIKDGTIDAIATDHAPHTSGDKEVPFENAANGIVGLETAFGLGYTYLVKKGVITLNELIAKLTHIPSGILGLSKGTIETDRVADITILDIESQYTVDASSFQSKGRNTPFNGFALCGRPVSTIVGGKIVMRDGQIV